jgi:16S rRNA (cytidine1402-2'-O)-methyltransferase
MKRNKSFNSDNVLYLVAIPIGNLKEMTPRAIEVLNMVDIVAAEDTRNAGLLLSKFNIKKEYFSLREHNESVAANHIVELIKQGKKVAYMSDAGYPCISDPGKILVKKARENDIAVSTISGSCAFLNGLAASSILSNRFYFHGFLPSNQSQAKKELESLKNKEETIIFHESPHRISKTLKTMYEVLGNRAATIARELTKLNEEFIEGTLEELTHLDEDTLIGEMVIIVEGKTDNNEEISDEDIIKKYEYFTQNGMKSKDAIKVTSDELKIKKNYVYDLVIQHKNK